MSNPYQKFNNNIEFLENRPYINKHCKALTLIVVMLYNFCMAQSLPSPQAPQPSQFQNYGNHNFNPSSSYNPATINSLYSGTNEQNRVHRQNQQIINEVEVHQKQQREFQNELKKELSNSSLSIKYDLPSYEILKEAKLYREAYNKMLELNVESYSVKDVNFDIENAYLQNQQDKAEFDKTIKEGGDFLLAKMKELGYDTNNNVAKNYMLFQFFSESLQLTNGKKHLPFKYDFEDYMGTNDFSKMFVSKLISTGTGQCHSLPLLYLILAEQIDAEAFLSMSPNHSFIKFRDENNKWYNIELTNGMFTAPSFILNSGYIKAEALQNKIYLQNLTKTELLSNFYVDLANGYIHKFGYDEFVGEIIEKALQLYPNNINAHMIKANYLATRFEHVCFQLKINPRDRKQLQNIRNYPRAIEMLKEVNDYNRLIDDLGYAEMPAEAYEAWLSSLNELKNKQQSEQFKKQFKVKTIQKLKD